LKVVSEIYKQTKYVDIYRNCLLDGGAIPPSSTKEKSQDKILDFFFLGFGRMSTPGVCLCLSIVIFILQREIIIYFAMGLSAGGNPPQL